MVSPADGATLTTLAPLFEWNVGEDTGVEATELEVATDRTFARSVGTALSNVTFGRARVRLTANLSSGSVYYWRTSLQCGSTQGPYSSTRSFATSPVTAVLLPPPTPLAVAIRETGNGERGVTLRWLPVAGAEEYLVTWNEMSAASAETRWASDTSIDLGSLPPNARYEWWVAARSAFAIGRRSPTQVFATTAPPQVGANPSPAQLTGPSPGLTVTSTPVPVATPTPNASQTDYAVGYQINPQHSGQAPGHGLNPPLIRKWSVDLGGPISYPIIAQGKVFVTVETTPNAGTTLYAFDERTGHLVWGPAFISGRQSWSAAAYDDGSLFVANSDGQMTSYDAETGQLRWLQRYSDAGVSDSPPVAAQGVVYLAGASGGSMVLALDEATGDIRWRANTPNSYYQSPALSDGGVFITSSCPVVTKLSRLTGVVLWRSKLNCVPAGFGMTATYYRGRVYVRDQSGGLIIDDAQQGRIVGTFPLGTIPAFDGDAGFVQASGKLIAINAATGNQVWTFAEPGGSISTAPIVVNHRIYVGSASNKLYALDATSGRIVWQTDVGSSLPSPGEAGSGWPLTGLGAGDGWLIVPAGRQLVAYTSLAAGLSSDPVATRPPVVGAR